MFKKIKKLLRKSDRPSQYQTPDERPVLRTTSSLPSIYDEILPYGEVYSREAQPIPDQHSGAIQRQRYQRDHLPDFTRPLPDVPSSLSPLYRSQRNSTSGYESVSKLDALRDSIAVAEGAQLRSVLLSLVDGLEINLLPPPGQGRLYHEPYFLIRDDASIADIAQDPAETIDSHQSSALADSSPMRRASAPVTTTEDTTRWDLTHGPHQLSSSTHNNVDSCRISYTSDLAADAVPDFQPRARPPLTPPPSAAATTTTTQPPAPSTPSIHNSTRATTPHHVSDNFKHTDYDRKYVTLQCSPPTSFVNLSNMSYTGAIAEDAVPDFQLTPTPGAPPVAAAAVQAAQSSPSVHSNTRAATPQHVSENFTHVDYDRKNLGYTALQRSSPTAFVNFFNLSDTGDVAANTVPDFKPTPAPRVRPPPPAAKQSAPSTPSIHNSTRATTPHHVSDNFRHTDYDRKYMSLQRSPPTSFVNLSNMSDTESVDSVSVFSSVDSSSDISSVSVRRRSKMEGQSFTDKFREHRVRSRSDVKERSGSYYDYTSHVHKVKKVYHFHITNHGGSVLFPAAAQGIQCGNQNYMNLGDYERQQAVTGELPAEFDVVGENQSSDS